MILWKNKESFIKKNEPRGEKSGHFAKRFSLKGLYSRFQHREAFSVQQYNYFHSKKPRG